MVKASKGNLIILGLSDENLERLKSGQPIKFNLAELSMGDIDVFIFHGKTEQAMYEMMKETIDPIKTVMKDSRSEQN